MGERMDRMVGPRAKIEGAKEHAANLEAAIRAYREREPYRLVFEDDPKTGDRTYRLQVREQPEPRIGRLVGDVLQNLRSSLELLAWQLVDANGGLPADERERQHIGFPISERAEDFEPNGLRKVEGASEEAKDLLRAVKPYKGGNDSLWRLHHLNRMDKHRVVGLVGGSYSAFALTVPSAGMLQAMADQFGIAIDQVPRREIIIKPASKQFPLKDGDAVFGIGAAAREATGDEHPKIAIDIALSQPGILEGEPVLPTMHQLTSTVEETVELFAPLLEGH
jgi:hypothetical protein